MSISVDALRATLDEFVSRLDADPSLISDGEFFRKLLDVLLRSTVDKCLVDDRVLLILRDCYLKLFRSWRDGERFVDPWGSVFSSIAHLFLKLVTHLTPSDVSPLKDLLFHGDLLHELNAFLKRLSINREFLHNGHLQSVDDLLRTLERLERHHSASSPLAESIVECICSSTFLDTFPELNESVAHRFLFSTCVDYLVGHSTAKDNFLRIRQALLRPFTNWLSEQSTYFRLWSMPQILLVRQLSFLLSLTIQNDRWTPLDASTFADFSRLIDSFVNILFSVVQSETSISTQKLGQTWIATIVPTVSTLILSRPLEKYLKDKHVAGLILKLVENDNEEIQLNAWRILSSIFTEHSVDVRRLVELLAQAMEKINDQPLRFHHFLRCLKSEVRVSFELNVFIFSVDLIQFDSIQDQWIEQDLLRLLLRSVQSVEILLELSFHPAGLRQMKNNVKEIRSMFDSEHRSVLIDHLLWRLDDEHRREKIGVSSPSDLLFISSPRDRDICQRLAEELRRDNYRLVFDDEEKNNNMSNKSQLIDQAESIVICMSDALKENLVCRCEASYVLERHQNFIPLIVSATSRPSGWLNTLINGKVYIDFVKLDFDLAVKKLKSELRRPPVVSLPPATEYLNRLASSKDFSALQPILSEMNESLLRQLALMCLDNRESMFHTLRNELTALNSSTPPLTLIVYLRFLSEIETCFASA